MIYFLAGVAAIAGLLFGYDEGVIAVASPSLERSFPMSAVENGFMIAAVPLGALAGAVIAGRLTERLGRRRVLMLAAALFTVGALAAAAVQAVWMLMLARLVLGLAIGVAAVVAPLFIAEAAPLRIRGALVSTYQLAITAGIVLSYLTGLVVTDEASWRVMFALGAVPGITFLIGLCFLPESPRWLLLRDRESDAKASLVRLRGQAAGIDGEIAAIRATVAAERRVASQATSIMAPWIRPALIVGTVLFFLQQLSGINAVIYYAPTIFQHAGLSSGSTQVMATIGVGVVNFLVTSLAMTLIDRWGRRPLLIAGFVGTAATLLLIAVAVLARGHVPLVDRRAGAVRVYRVVRHQSWPVAAPDDGGSLSAERARRRHEHCFDEQLGLQFHRRVPVPLDAERDRSRGRLHRFRHRLPWRSAVHHREGAGNP